METRFLFHLDMAEDQEASVNEAEIRAEVERRKQRAKELGLVQIVFRLYHDHLKFLDEDFDHEKSSVPKSLTKVVRTRLHHGMDSTESIELFLGDNSMVFVFKECNTTMPDGEIWTSGNILINIDAKTVFDLRCTCTDDRYMGREWSAGDVEGFIEGPWVDEVKTFAQQVSSLYGQRNSRLKQERERDELQQLKNRFGI